LTKRAGSINACVKKEDNIGKVIMRKVATNRKSKIHNRKWKTWPISVCECLTVIFSMLY